LSYFMPGSQASTEDRISMLRISPNKPKTIITEPAESVEHLTHQAEKFINQNNLDSALPLLKNLLKYKPEEANLLSTTGLIALKLENRELAEQCFQKVVKLRPDDFDANYNLALLNLIQGRDDDALVLLKHLRCINPNNSDLLNDIALIWSNRKKPGRTLATYSRALKINPNNSNIRNNAMSFCLEEKLIDSAKKILAGHEMLPTLTETSKAEIHHWKEILNETPDFSANNNSETVTNNIVETKSGIKNKKIAFFAGHQAFITDIITHLSENNDVKLFDADTAEEMNALMEWADLAWFEWCDNLIIEATKLPKKCKIICRLHSYEAFTEMPSQVDWSKVDQLVFVNQSVMELAKPQIGSSVPLTIIYNGVDLDKFRIPESKQDSSQPLCKKIASVGYINYKKNPGLLLYCFKKIYQHDSEFSLHIAGSHQDPRIKLYFDNYLKCHPMPVYFDGWIDDMPSWYTDKGFVISTSLFESFHYSIAEGMASGLIPLIHDWYGADTLYPEQFLFSDPDECAGLVNKMSQSDLVNMRIANRQHINEKFNHHDKIKEISNLLARVLSKE